MILRVFGHQAPREPLLYLLWMTLAVTISEFGAMRISNEHRTRKNAHTKRDDYKTHSAALPMQAEFPYRYVFPANHPFSSFTQFLNPPPPAVPQYANDNVGYSVYPTGVSQEYPSHQPEYKFAIKAPSPYHQQANAQPFSPSSVQMTPIPFQPGSPHMLLLLHTGNAGSAGPIQTFMLVPADSGQHFGNLAIAPQQPQQQQHQLQQQFGGLTALPASSFGIQPHTIPTASLPPPMILRPSGYTKSSKSHHYHNQLNMQLLQRPIGVYQMPAGKYYPQKKSSMESKMSASENVNSVSNKPPSTSTEPMPDNVNPGKRNLGSKSKNVQ